MTVSDDQALAAMRLLAQGGDRQDIPIVAGESGVAGLAALRLLRDDSDCSARVGLDAQSRVLIINTEGATAPAAYQALVGESASSVQRRQAAWRDRESG